MSLRRELVNRRALERLSRSQDNGRKIRLVDRIGKMLSFEAETPVPRIENAADAGDGAVQMIRGKELDARLGGQYVHNPARLRLVYARGHRNGLAAVAQHKVV